MKSNLQKAFTLIELLVVIAVIGMMSAIVFGALNSARAKGKDTAVKSDLANLSSATEMFYYINPGSESWNAVCADSKISAIVSAAGGTCQGSGAAGWRTVAPFNVQNQWGAGSGVDYWCVDYKQAKRICDVAPAGQYGGLYVCNTGAPENCK
ncbi:MAG: type II secretion system protein [Minisyncoccia bacterium]